MSVCMENCQKYIAKSHCSPIQGTIFVFLLKYGTAYKQPNILVYSGKLLELRSNVYFFSNAGGKVKITAEIL